MSEISLNSMSEISAGYTPRRCFFAPFELLFSGNHLPNISSSLTLINYCWNY